MAQFRNILVESGKFAFKDKRIEFNGILSTDDKELIEFLESSKNWTKEIAVKKEKCFRDLQYLIEQNKDKIKTLEVIYLEKEKNINIQSKKLELEINNKIEELKFIKSKNKEDLEAVKKESKIAIKDALSRLDDLEKEAKIKLKIEVDAETQARALILADNLKKSAKENDKRVELGAQKEKELKNNDSKSKQANLKKQKENEEKQQQENLQQKAADEARKAKQEEIIKNL